MKQFYLISKFQRRPIQRHPYDSREVSNFFLRRIKTRKQNKQYIRKVSVGFVKCREWRVAFNRPTLDRRVRAAGGLCRPYCLYDVTTIPASVCVFSFTNVLLSCSCVPTASCDTLWHNTDAILINIAIRRPSVATTILSVSQRSTSRKDSKLHSRA